MLTAGAGLLVARRPAPACPVPAAFVTAVRARPALHRIRGGRCAWPVPPAGRARHGPRFAVTGRGQGRGDHLGAGPHLAGHPVTGAAAEAPGDRKSTRLNSSHSQISYAVFCLKKKKQTTI